MISAGIDIGARTIKVLVLRDGQVAARAIRIAGFDVAPVAHETMALALQQAGVARAEVEVVVASGAGRDQAPDSDRSVTEVGAAARGGVHLVPTARTVVDVGAEEGRAIRVDDRGRVVDFAVSERCAAGAGAFTEAMARALEVRVEELGPLSLQSTRSISINAQCVVFAESEVVSMIHDNVPLADIARAVHDAIAGRIVSMVHRVGLNCYSRESLRPAKIFELDCGLPAALSQPLVLVGGLARNVGFVDALRRGLGVDQLEVAAEPEFCVALGAALAASDGRWTGAGQR